MLKTLCQGLFAGLLASLLAAGLFIIDSGPAVNLHGIARWFHLDAPDSGRWAGLLLLLLIGTVFGLLFALATRTLKLELGRWLLAGLVTGVVCWVLFALVIGEGINHVSVDLGALLAYGIPLLFYGFMLGSISFQLRIRPGMRDAQPA